MISFPPFRLDAEQERLWKGETLLSLRKKPFAILRYLATHPKQLVTHEELLREIWGGSVVSDSAMRSHLHELRQVLGDGVIETVIGRGYRFVAKLSDDVVVETSIEIDPLVVGRETEVQTLRAALDRVRTGRRQLCFVTGEPGIGKTTLVRTFLAGLDQNAVIIARGACFEQHGTPEPYLPIVDAFTALTRSNRSAQATAALVRYAPTFVAQLPQLVTEEQLTQITRRAAGGNESRQLRELCEAIESMCAQDPLVFVLEDLQWSDIASIDLLSLLGQRQERAKLLVLGTSRHAEIQSPEHPLNRVMRSLVTRSGALALQLPKIDATAVQSFIDRRFAGHTFPKQLTELVAKITGGTPLFMVALLDELVGRGMITEQAGRWELSLSIDEIQAHRPASVQQLIDIQLDRLSATEQRVLEAASIVGSEFATELVAAALEQPVADVDDTCDALARRSLFLRAEHAGRYAVTHALIQKVCVERSSAGRRQHWHRLVAEALENGPPQLRAKHFDAAGDPARAIPAYVAAAHQAARRYATSDAVTLSARGLRPIVWSDTQPRTRPVRASNPRCDLPTSQLQHLQWDVCRAQNAGGVRTRHRARTFPRRPCELVRRDHRAVQLSHDHRAVRPLDRTPHRARAARAGPQLRSGAAPLRHIRSSLHRVLSRRAGYLTASAQTIGTARRADLGVWPSSCWQSLGARPSCLRTLGPRRKRARAGRGERDDSARRTS